MREQKTFDLGGTAKLFYWEGKGLEARAFRTPEESAKQLALHRQINPVTSRAKRGRPPVQAPAPAPAPQLMSDDEERVVANIRANSVATRRRRNEAQQQQQQQQRQPLPPAPASPPQPQGDIDNCQLVAVPRPQPPPASIAIPPQALLMLPADNGSGDGSEPDVPAEPAAAPAEAAAPGSLNQPRWLDLAATLLERHMSKGKPTIERIVASIAADADDEGQPIDKKTFSFLYDDELGLDVGHLADLRKKLFFRR